MMRTLTPSLMIAAIVVAAGAAVASAESRAPNVVFIMVDDLGWSDLSYNGSKVYETPNVDRLASEGMTLSDFYSGGPVCSPTRSSIMTGKYTARTGITTYLLSPTRDAKHVQSHLPLEEFTIAEAFGKNGYATGYFGKWHLGYENDFWAGNQGFDVAKGGIDLPWAWTLCYPDMKEEAPTARTWPKTHTRFFSPYHLTHLDNGPDGEYLTERLTDETISFIEQHRDEPFFAFLSFHTVHTPLQAKQEKIDKYRRKIAALGLDTKKEKNGREKEFQNNAAYAAMVEHMDENVGRLLKRLDELKLSDDTIVVWTSDNGGKGSVTSNLPLRGMKHNLYEGGIRVPTVVRWPHRIPAGSTNATPLISNDFYPTLLELTGRPLEPKQHLDGVSFRKVLTGEAESVDRDALYWHYPHSRQEAAIRMGRHKLLHRFKEDRVELYDLQQDIGERNDLSESKPELARKLLARLKQWQRDVGAKFEGDIWASTDASQSKAAPAKARRTAEQLKQMPNVLFISVDDWNDWVGCLGHKQAQTPNVDRLASRGLLFTNAHCVAPVCNPSRVATLTGLRPDTTGVYENNHVMRRKAPNVVTLPQHFREHGYHVAGGGKVFHDVPPHCDDPLSWDEYFWWNEHGPKGGQSGSTWRSPYSIPPDPQPDGRPMQKITPLTKRNFDWGAVDEPESNWPDSKVADWASKFLAREHDKPFFLSVGIFRPHVPWFNPARFVEKYPLDDLLLPPVKVDDLDDLSEWARRRAHDKASQHEQLVEFGEWKPAVQAYLASISFADANVGRVLYALEKSPHRDNTIVVFWSDHGYHLGEKGHWHKRTLWERATHVPFIVSTPNTTRAGTKCSRPVSLLDIYPTLISLCDLDRRTELEGNDLSPLLAEPQAEWKHAAVTTWQPDNHSVRTDDWRYIRYSTGEEELYDHRTDPNEWNNLAANEEFAKKKSELAQHLPKPAGVATSGDKPAPTQTIAFVADGKATGLISAGEAWKLVDGKLVGSGKPNRLYASHGLSSGDFQIDATLSLDKLNGTAAAFEIGASNFFGFEGAKNEFYLNGRIFGGRRRLMQSNEHLADGRPFRFQAIRRGDVIRFLIDGKELLQIKYTGPLNRLAFSPARATMRIEQFVVTGGLVAAEHLPKAEPPAAREASIDRPNILLIVSEDNGADLGCYGTPDVRTPRLDQLAAEGCRFANAYVPHAVCSASRAAFLTGLYPFQNGQIGLATHRYAMFRNWDNLPSVLKSHGYRTGLMGKLHVNPESAFPFDFRWNESKANSFGSRDVQRVAEVAGEFFRETKQPFFLSLNFSDAHFPVLRHQNGLPEKPLSGKDVSGPLPFIGADSPRLRQGTADYYNCMMRLDSGVGMVLDELEKAGRKDDTLVIYIGDHGAQFSRGKATCYEGGLRIPMIVRWPAQVKPQTVRDELVTTIDILPTVLQATALPTRDSLPGRSLLPLAADREVPWRKYLFAERTAYHSGSFYPQRTLRDERYKIIVNLTPDERNPVARTYETQTGSFFIYGTHAEEIAAAPKHIQQAYATWANPPPVELYDLQEDPWEFRNLVDSPDLAEVRQRLLAELQRFRERHGDPLLDAEKLKKLAEEHHHVATKVKGGRYASDENWKYLTYLRPAHLDASEAEAALSFTSVFTRGEDGYPDYRIPSLVTTREGTLLAMAEGRQSLSDHARNDIVVKRSTDNGRTWGPLIRVHQDDESVLVNPCAVVLESGRVLVMYQRFPNGYHARAIGNLVKLLESGLKGSGVCTTLISWSDDDGKTWSKPTDVTAGTKRAEKINSTATGPGQGIVLTRGKHKGRIIMPTNEGWWDDGQRFFNVYACYSDDGGETWQFGKPAPNGENGQGNEVQMVELSDGSVMLNTRSYRGTGFRKTALSRDGGRTWSPLADENQHPEPGCMGSILRYSFGDGQENRLLFTNPNSQRGRRNGTVRMSFDDGKTWPIERVVYPGAYAYSCLTRLHDGSIGVVFEADAYREIKFVRLDLDWLMSGTGDRK